MSLTIRPAVREDAETIWVLVKGLAEYEILTEYATGNVGSVTHYLFDAPVASCLIAEYDGVSVGYSIYFPLLSTFRMKPGIWLEDLFVLESHRGKGIGKALIQAVIAEAREKGYARVDWTVLDWNESAIGFYRSLGAEILPDWRVCRYSLLD